MPKYEYRFSDGHTTTSNLSRDELAKRMDRLNTLIVITEPYEDGYGYRIYQKALNAYNRSDNFTGIIRLTFAEKDWLSYLLENDMLPKKDIDVINYYIRN
jgi:hypothetical protein